MPHLIEALARSQASSGPIAAPAPSPAAGQPAAAAPRPAAPVGAASAAARSIAAPATPSAPLPPAPGASGVATSRMTIRDMQARIFTPHCASCHSGPGAPNGLTFEQEPDALRRFLLENPTRNNRRYIVPGNAKASMVHERVTSTDELERMPFFGTPLDADLIRDLEAWIKAGAP